MLPGFAANFSQIEKRICVRDAIVLHCEVIVTDRRLSNSP